MASRSASSPSAFRYLGDAIAGDHQLSHQVHQRVESTGIDANVASRFRHRRLCLFLILRHRHDGELGREGLRKLPRSRPALNAREDLRHVELRGSRGGRQVYRLLQRIHAGEESVHDHRRHVQ